MRKNYFSHNAAVSEFLSRRILISRGFDGLSAAMIQMAFRDCYARRGDSSDGELRSPSEVRLEAAVWLLTDGRYLARLTGVASPKFEEAIRSLIPPELRSAAETKLKGEISVESVR